MKDAIRVEELSLPPALFRRQREDGEVQMRRLPWRVARCPHVARVPRVAIGLAGRRQPLRVLKGNERVPHIGATFAVDLSR